MNRTIVVFSSRKQGNCEHIAEYIKEYENSWDIFYFSERSIVPCGVCSYECFTGTHCPHLDDGEGELLAQICRSDEVIFVLPNYCDYPCANFFIFNERSNGYFQHHSELLQQYLAVPKKFIVVSNSQSSHFREAFQQHTDKEPEILFLSAKACGTVTTRNALMQSDSAVHLVQDFLKEGNNMNIRLAPMTTELAKVYFQEFAYDSDVFMDVQPFKTFVYSDTHAEQIVQRQAQKKRVYMAILLDGKPIGEIVLKKIHQPEGSCTLGIHMQNDSVKNKGYGTKAERLALEYAFETLGLKTVYADALHKNTRSQNVLQKVGFQRIDEDEFFIYYRCDNPKS